MTLDLDSDSELSEDSELSYDDDDDEGDGDQIHHDHGDPVAEGSSSAAIAFVANADEVKWDGPTGWWPKRNRSRFRECYARVQQARADYQVHGSSEWYATGLNALLSDIEADLQDCASKDEILDMVRHLQSLHDSQKASLFTSDQNIQIVQTLSRQCPEGFDLVGALRQLRNEVEAIKRPGQ